MSSDVVKEATDTQPSTQTIKYKILKITSQRREIGANYLIKEL